VGIGFGALPVIGAAWLQTGRFDFGAVLICLPVSAWAAAILIINEVPDVDSDQRVHKRTLVVRCGAGGAKWVYGGLTAIALAASAVAILRHILPIWYTLPALALAALGLLASAGISFKPSGRRRLKQCIELTIATHIVGCLAIITALLSRRVIS